MIGKVYLQLCLFLHKTCEKNLCKLDFRVTINTTDTNMIKQMFCIYLKLHVHGCQNVHPALMFSEKERSEIGNGYRQIIELGTQFDIDLSVQ